MTSQIGQTVLTLGGAFVGSLIGGPLGPSIGLLIGSTAGQLLFPTKLPTQFGPRLTELQIQTSTIGAPIPIVIGSFALAGNVIWYSGLIETEHKTKQGGKGGALGGPEQTTKTYTYSMSIAVGICEPMEVTGIDGIRRIWADAICIYDKRPQQDDESDEDYTARLAATAQTEELLTIYTGSEDQLPDPTIESYEGADNVSAYRGLAYCVFTDFELEKYGNRPPNFRFECYTGAVTDVDCSQYSPGNLQPWNLNSRDPRPVSQRLVYRNQGGGGTTTDNLEDWITINHPGLNSTFYGYKIEGASSESDPNYPFVGLPGTYEGVRIYPQFIANQTDLPVVTSCAWSVISNLTDCFGEMLVAYWTGDGGPSPQPSGQWLSSEEVLNGSFDYEDHFNAAESGGYWPNDPNPPWSAFRYNTTLDLKRSIQPLDHADDPNFIEIAPGFYQNITTGAIEVGMTWTQELGTFKCLQKAAATSGGGPDAFEGTYTAYPVGPCLRNDDANYNVQAYWEAAYADAVAAGTMDAGLTYGVDYPETQTFAWLGECEAEAIDADCIPMPEAVEYICRRCNIPLWRVDTSDLNSCVYGYAITGQMTGRDALTPLMTYGLFDAVESGTDLKFVERGHASVATLESDELAARNGGSSPPSVMETTTVLVTSLPKRLSLRYASPDREYEIGEQQAARISTRATKIESMDLAISMSDEQAAQLVEIILWAQHAAKDTYTAIVAHPRLALEPTDCLVAPVDGQLERMRIVATDYSLIGTLRLELVRDDDGSYVSTAVPGEPDPSGGQQGPGGGVVCPVESILLDLPSLRPQDTDAGYYWAVRSLCDRFSCAVLYRSNDGGDTYEWTAQATTESTIGTVDDAITGGYEITLDSGGPLSSATDAQLDSGVNLAAIGADGRWYLFQFGTATYDTNDAWTLSDIRGGLFGTAAYADDVTAGDRFVLLRESDLVRIDETPASCGVEKYFKGVACGQSVDAVEPFTFTTQCLSYVAPPSPNTIISATTVIAPDDPANGDAYLIPCDGVDTGTWNGHEGELARWSDQANNWLYSTPETGTVFYVEDVDQYITYAGPCSATNGGIAPPPWAAGTIAIYDDSTLLALLNELSAIILGDNLTGTVDSSGVLTIDASGGGTSVSGSWNFDTSTTAANPGTKKFRMDSATPASVTELYFNDITVENIDASTVLGFLSSGHRIYLQQNDDASRAILFEVTGSATDNTGWWTVPVSVVESASLYGANETCTALILLTSGGGALSIYDEGVLQGTTTSLDFVGGAVTADVDSSGAGTVTIRGVPRISTGATTATTAVCDKCYAATGNITVPNAVFSEGDIFSIYNDTGSSISIAQGSGLTLRLSGTNSTGNRTLARRGLATVWFNSTSEAVCLGQGLT